MIFGVQLESILLDLDGLLNRLVTILLSRLQLFLILCFEIPGLLQADQVCLRICFDGEGGRGIDLALFYDFGWYNQRQGFRLFRSNEIWLDYEYFLHILQYYQHVYNQGVI